jgi:propionyl-CoA synthetase
MLRSVLSVRSFVQPKSLNAVRRATVVSALQLNKTSIENPNEFWSAAAKKVDWIEPPSTTLNTKVPHGRWFEDGKLNTAYNCLDRHIKAGRGSQLALVHDSPVTNTITKYTYDELLEQTVQLACVLRKLGVEKGDRVVIYMPNIPEAAISMLACARIGAIHSVVFGGFADAELATRIRDSKPKVVLASSCGIENSKVLDYKKLLDSALKIASVEHEVQNCVIFQRDAFQAPLVAGRDIDMRKAMKEEASATYADRARFEVMDSSDPLYILYTSGTTGKPKGVVRDNGGHAVALRWSMENIYNMKQNDVFWAARYVNS